MDTRQEATGRILWIDVAKGLGIALVFYGHLVERFMHLGEPAAALQMRWIYAFHMPLFFFLSGLVYKERNLAWGTFLKRQVRSRLVPAWVFNGIGALIWIGTEYARGPEGWVAGHGWARTLAYAAARFGRETLTGLPTFNILMWFLVCLFVVELVQFALRRRLRTTRSLVLSILSAAVLTFLLTYFREPITTLYGTAIDGWHLTSAVAAVVFYQGGILVQRLGWLTSNPVRWRCGLCAGVCLLVTCLTYDLNHPPGYPVVFLAHGAYGNVGWFFLTACAGTIFTVCLSQLLVGAGWLAYVGRLTLGLMCLNGIMHHSLNLPLAEAVTNAWPETGVWERTALRIGITLVCLAVAVPVVLALQRWTPFLLGMRPRRSAA